MCDLRFHDMRQKKGAGSPKGESAAEAEQSAGYRLWEEPAYPSNRRKR
jgi:hypothetical protein